MYDPITSAALFFVLVPGVLVTLPPGVSLWISALVHAVVFYVLQTYASMFVPYWGVWVAAGLVLALAWWRSRSAV